MWARAPAAWPWMQRGSYVYVANFGSNNISAFSLTTASGKLTAISGSPFSSGGQMPLAFVNDNQKKYIAVINNGSNGSTGNSDLQLFGFDATTDGKLDPIINSHHRNRSNVSASDRCHALANRGSLHSRPLRWNSRARRYPLSFLLPKQTADPSATLRFARDNR